MLNPGLGVTVLPEWLQVEGPEAVLDRLQAIGVTAVSTSPYVMRPAEPGEAGAREPPADAGAGEVRLLDRPLWHGRRALVVATAPSFEPDRVRYAGLRYQPAEPDRLTRREGPVVRVFLESAKGRGLEAYLQVQAAIPPGYRVQFGGPDPDDEPRLPDGRRVADRVDKNGSLASPAIRAYTIALLEDLAASYPMIDGFRLDWPEYPPYGFDALWFDFSEHALQLGQRLGHDTLRLRRDATALLASLADALNDRLLDDLLAEDRRPAVLGEVARRFRLDDLLRFKAALSFDFLASLPRIKPLIPQTFPPPWTALGGFDLARSAAIVPAIGVKLYTMHWPMMLGAYGRALALRAPTLDRVKLARALAALLDVGGTPPASLEDLRYPEPDEPHPAGADALVRKIRAARSTAGGRCPVVALGHAYGPRDDVLRRARIALEASGGMLWINRYGYLSDDKLAGLGELVRGTRDR